MKPLPGLIILLLLAACKGSDKSGSSEPSDASDLTAVTPYTRDIHALRGPVSEVTTVTSDSDNSKVYTEYRSFNPNGRMVAESVTLDSEGIEGDTLRIAYADDGTVILDEPSITPVYDSCRRLVSVRYCEYPRAAIEMVYTYDDADRLTSETTVAEDGMSDSGPTELTSVTYDYDRHGLRRVSRRNRSHAVSVLLIDSTGAPVEELLYDPDGLCSEHTRYHIQHRDRNGNWTGAKAGHRHITRKITYHGNP